MIRCALLLLGLTAAATSSEAPAGPDARPATRPALDDIRQAHAAQARAAGLDEKVLRRLLESGPSNPPADQAALELVLALVRDIHPRLAGLRLELRRAGMKPDVLDALVRTAVAAFNEQEMGPGEEEFPAVTRRIQGAVRLAEQAGGLGRDRALAVLRDRAVGAFNGGHFGRGPATFDVRLAELEQAAGDAAEHPAAPASRPAEQPAQAPTPAQALLDLHNQVRLRHNLHALRLEPRLSAAAQKYAEFMARTGRYGHYEKDNPGKRVMDEGYRFRSVGENYAAGLGTPEAVVQAWLISPSHRQAMLGGYVHAGFGLAKSKEGHPVWVALFAIPR